MLKTKEVYAKPFSNLEGKIVEQFKGGFSIFTRNRGDSFWTLDSKHLTLKDASEVLSVILFA